MHSNCYQNEGVSSLVSGVDSYIIRKLLDSIFNILSVFVRWWGFQTYLKPDVASESLPEQGLLCEWYVGLRQIECIYHTTGEKLCSHGSALKLVVLCRVSDELQSRDLPRIPFGYQNCEVFASPIQM
jgi:hypothetical protein